MSAWLQEFPTFRFSLSVNLDLYFHSVLPLSQLCRSLNPNNSLSILFLHSSLWHHPFLPSSILPVSTLRYIMHTLSCPLSVHPSIHSVHLSGGSGSFRSRSALLLSQLSPINYYNVSSQLDSQPASQPSGSCVITKIEHADPLTNISLWGCALMRSVCYRDKGRLMWGCLAGCVSWFGG